MIEVWLLQGEKPTAHILLLYQLLVVSHKKNNQKVKLWNFLFKKKDVTTMGYYTQKVSEFYIYQKM